VKSLIVCLSIFMLSACRERPSPRLVERCLTDIKNQLCHCHAYQLDAEDSGSLGETISKPLEYCHKLIGFPLKDWASVHMYIEEWNNIYRANQNDYPPIEGLPY